MILVLKMGGGVKLESPAAVFIAAAKVQISSLVLSHSRMAWPFCTFLLVSGSWCPLSFLGLWDYGFY